MSWESNTVLEGIFEFGAPLNIWRAQLVRGGKEPSGLEFSHVHMQIDNDEYLAARLDQKIKAVYVQAYDAGEPLYYFPRLIIMRRAIQNWKEWVFVKPWLHGVYRNYKMTGYPYDTWDGWTLGFCFDNTAANRTAALDLFGDLQVGNLHGDQASK